MASDGLTNIRSILPMIKFYLDNLCNTGCVLGFIHIVEANAVCEGNASSRDLARTQQKGGGGLVHQSIFHIPCIPL